MKTILQPGRNCLGLFDVEETGLLVDARNYYLAFFDAARQAQRFILVAGWQFDSDVELVRGSDRSGRGSDTSLLPFLNRLCEKNPYLQVRILAWDFSMLFSLEREWFQEWIFDWSTSSRLKFRFDANHPLAGSHHQKFAVIDGRIAFLGGTDICSSRWDDRRHRADNPERRNGPGEVYGPYHDVHSYHTGAIAKTLVSLFRERWIRAGGEPLLLEFMVSEPKRLHPPLLPIAAAKAALSRTRPRSLLSPGAAVQEIRALYRDAIDAADRLIYMENQYFTSRLVFDALCRRMEERGRPKLQIVIVLPRRPKALREEISLGAEQMRLLAELQEIARLTGHSLGIYYPVSSRGTECSVYVHSKLLLVDDRFLTVGSANTTNRSMGLDSELNIAWEADSPRQRELIRSICGIRTSLLLELTGLAGIRGWREGRRLSEGEGLVAQLDNLADGGVSRLRRHELEPFDNKEWIRDLLPKGFNLDPEFPPLENVYELFSAEETAHFMEGIGSLSRRLSAPMHNQAGSAAVPDVGRFRLLPARSDIRLWIVCGIFLLLLFVMVRMLLR